MRLRIFVLIMVCILLDVLVVRQVRQYDEQKLVTAFGDTQDEQEAALASHKEGQSGQVDAAQESQASAASC